MKFSNSVENFKSIKVYYCNFPIWGRIREWISKNWPNPGIRIFGHNFCFVVKWFLLIKMNYQPQKFWSWGQNEGHSSPIKFWVQGKNDQFFPQHFHNFLMIFWYIFMYFATYKKFGAPFFRFGKISQIFTISMVKNEKFWPRP